MSYQRYPNQRRGRNQEAWMEQTSPHHEISRLNALLSDERAKWFQENHRSSQLWQELQETKAQLDKQKSLKEVFIKKEKEVRQELQRLQKYSDAETLSSTKIASQVQSSIKQRKKKSLQQDYEELKVAHVMSQERFSAELQQEKEKTKALQQQLDEAKRSYEELSNKYEKEVVALRQQAAAFQQQAAETQSQVDAEKQLQNHLKETSAQEIQKLREISQEKESKLQKELEQMATSYSHLKTKHEMDVSALKVMSEAFLQQLCKDMHVSVQNNKESLETINNLQAENETMTQENFNLEMICSNFEADVDRLTAELKDQIEINLQLSSELKDTQLDSPNPEKPLLETPDGELTSPEKKKSFWKRARHFLGLKKPGSWKKTKNASI
ncbi:putative mediator of RNA polymerase II transcription subunit 26 [Kryptolebias marmoratus]|uniref:putative mediator of RNA polymerase II transcription subunit 26 n=1 Tax=Kryptolebias marmoratus TaxID=37003 RepID=UPI0018ACA50F|nr:putative mediator of RNA polymerase II transcription subunit 26 [Kryptolebias marmoratus]